MPWNSCLFRKIHMPFTDTFMTQVLAFSGKEAEGLWALRQAVPAAMPPHHQEGLEGVIMRGAFSPARPSSAGPALRGKEHVGPGGDVPQCSDC